MNWNDRLREALRKAVYSTETTDRNYVDLHVDVVRELLGDEWIVCEKCGHGTHNREGTELEGIGNQCYARNETGSAYCDCPGTLWIESSEHGNIDVTRTPVVLKLTEARGR